MTAVMLREETAHLGDESHDERAAARDSA